MSNQENDAFDEYLHEMKQEPCKACGNNGGIVSSWEDSEFKHIRLLICKHCNRLSGNSQSVQIDKRLTRKAERK